MPINRDEFETTSPDDLLVGTEAIEEAILDFLAFSPELAYTRREIRSEVDATIFSIATALTTLEEQGFVRRKGSYWMVTEQGREAIQE